MDHKVLRKGLGLIHGLTFDPISESSKDLDGILSPFITAGLSNATPDEVCEAIIHQIGMLFLVCVKNKDVYIRVRGDKSFCYLLLSEWNPATLATLFTPELLGKLLYLFVGARRRYLSDQDSIEESTNLTTVIDAFITTIDHVASTVQKRHPPSLKPPKDFKVTRPWPPDYFSKFDVAILGETTTRRALFGIDHKHKGDEEDAPLYPHDQSPPLYVRKYLCWLSLTETKPDSKGALFLAPIAFISDQQRQEWYNPTGHKSRFYATVTEFLDYARVEFEKTGTGARHHVIGLLTPWFFDVEEVMSEAARRDEAIPTVWEKTCFRAGMVLCLSKFVRSGFTWVYQLAMFRPGLPYYQNAAEPQSRRKKQDVWIRELRKEINEYFYVEKGWIGGKFQSHDGPPSSRKVSADSVELSNEFITKIMENPSLVPITRAEHVNMGFEEV
ncbi:hypothetical protein F5Y00DRAFT_273080 [Daldinia vernicosa]|uniref:uncharacterized protein n=1 Tax=Daldinia vernicosa TaxID=114800 RepID=UPI002008B408|nr:uncharacterized protein F5Y00DRAFT_273080 [Daldinia vernicosa]KAI0852454.1 hypothetical protein F5Y00DRAFT_273080 [Daldinia vernicosa]